MEENRKELTGSGEWNVSRSLLDFHMNGREMHSMKTYSDEFVIQNMTKNDLSFIIEHPDQKAHFALYTLDFPENGEVSKFGIQPVRVYLHFHSGTEVDTTLIIKITRNVFFREVVEYRKVRVEAKCHRSSVWLDWSLATAKEKLGENVTKARLAGKDIVAKVVRKPNYLKEREMYFKVLRPSDCAGERGVWNREVEIRDKFVKDIERVCKLSSPYLMPLVGAVFNCAGMAFVTDYAPLGSLAAVLDNYRLSEYLRARFMVDTARGLKYLHGSGMMHYNIKLEHIIVVSLQPSTDIVCKLTEAAYSSTSPDLNQMRDVDDKGKVYANVDPLFSQKGDYTSETEVFALGTIVCQIWSQTLSGPNRCKTVEAFNTEIRKLHAKTFPDDLRGIVMDCHKKEGAQRPTIEKIESRLNAFQDRMRRECMVGVHAESTLPVQTDIGEPVQISRGVRFDDVLDDDSDDEWPNDDPMGISCGGQSILQNVCMQCLRVVETIHPFPCNHRLCERCKDGKRCTLCDTVCEELRGENRQIARQSRCRHCKVEGCEQTAKFYSSETKFVCSEHKQILSSACTESVFVPLFGADDRLDNSLLMNYVEPRVDVEMCDEHKREVDSLCETCGSVKLCWKCHRQHFGHAIVPFVWSDVRDARRELARQLKETEDSATRRKIEQMLQQTIITDFISEETLISNLARRVHEFMQKL